MRRDRTAVRIFSTFAKKWKRFWKQRESGVPSHPPACTVNSRHCGVCVAPALFGSVVLGFAFARIHNFPLHWTAQLVQKFRGNWLHSVLSHCLACEESGGSRICPTSATKHRQERMTQMMRPRERERERPKPNR